MSVYDKLVECFPNYIDSIDELDLDRFKNAKIKDLYFSSNGALNIEFNLQYTMYVGCFRIDDNELFYEFDKIGHFIYSDFIYDIEFVQAVIKDLVKGVYSIENSERAIEKLEYIKNYF